jgi:FtsP/CotA-like multicopper oxidase with cupredoxin domain
LPAGAPTRDRRHAVHPTDAPARHPTDAPARDELQVVAKDGAPLPAPYEADVADVAPGERYDLLFTADEPGKWVFHCHIGHHLTNNGDGPGGLLAVVEVS